MFHLTTPQANIKEISIKSIWYGLIAGMISGMVKIGWENLFPPRTIARNLINPPQHMAMQLGVPKKLVESFVDYLAHYFNAGIWYNTSTMESTFR